jgi:hypothetical protein
MKPPRRSRHGWNCGDALARTEMLFSEPYLDETHAFVVKDHLREEFSSAMKNGKTTRLLLPPRGFVPRHRVLHSVAPERSANVAEFLENGALDQSPIPKLRVFH